MLLVNPSKPVLACLGHSGWFKAQFAGHLAKKEYLCLCHGRCDAAVPWRFMGAFLKFYRVKSISNDFPIRHLYVFMFW